MKVNEVFGGELQDDQIELMQRIMKFRDIVYSKVNGNETSSPLMFALIGMAHGYRPCCVFEFVEAAYLKVPQPKPHTIGEDGRVMCQRCIAGLLDQTKERDDGLA